MTKPKGKKSAADHKSAVLSALRKRYGDGSSRMASAGSRSDIVTVVPTGIEVLDNWILGCGGIPVGRMGEVFADASAGKTSLSFQIMAAFQRVGGVAAYVETENALHAPRMDTFGVDREQLILHEASTLEGALNAFRTIIDVLPGDKPSVIVLDTLAAAELSAQADADFGEAKIVGKRGKIMSEALPVLCSLAMKKHTAIVIINQIRDKIGVAFGDPTGTPGGHAPKFQSSWRLQMWKGGGVKVGEETIGQHVTVKAVKNKCAIPGHKAKLRLLWESGWDNDWALLDLAKERGLIKPQDRGAAAVIAARAALLAEATPA